MSLATFVTVEESVTLPLHIADDGTFSYTRNVFLGEPHVASDRPSAIRGTWGAPSFNPAHFHHTDQFQIFLGGSDTAFERKLTGPLMLHYSDYDTLYGPFGGDKEGFTSFGLKKHGSNFHGRMPKDKDAMSHDGTKRHHKVHLGEWLERPYPVAGEVQTEAVIGPYDDSLAAFTVAAGPHAVIVSPTPAGSGGQFFVLIEGAVTADGKLISKHTVGWADPGDEPPALRSEEEGARLLVLQFGLERPGKA